jgi:hypothetical protein
VWSSILWSFRAAGDHNVSPDYSSGIDPLSRAAILVATNHRQPDPRVWRPGRESNPEPSRSQGDAVIQTQGALKERSPKIRGELVFWK